MLTFVFFLILFFGPCVCITSQNLAEVSDWTLPIKIKNDTYRVMSAVCFLPTEGSHVGGHYVTYRRHGQSNEFFRINDGSVEQPSSSSQLPPDSLLPCLLVLKRVDAMIRMSICLFAMPATVRAQSYFLIISCIIYVSSLHLSVHISISKTLFVL